MRKAIKNKMKKYDDRVECILFEDLISQKFFKLKSPLFLMTSGRERDQEYSAKWKRLVNFMQHNTGLGVGGVAKAGSRREGTPTEYSDLDIIFYISRDPSKEIIYTQLITLIHANFDGAKADFGKSRNVIDMKLDDLEFDIVLLPEHRFKSQIQSYKIEKI